MLGRPLGVLSIVVWVALCAATDRVVAQSDRAANDQVLMEVIPDAWPGRPRTKGYEYNQKNHHAPPRFIRPKKAERPKFPELPGVRYRLVGVRLQNLSDSERKVELRFEGIDKQKPVKLTLPPDATVRRYFPIREPEGLRFELVLRDRDKRRSLVTREVVLPADGVVSRRAATVAGVAAELEREDRERRTFLTRSVEVSVRDDLQLTVPGARVLLLATEGLMVYEGVTDADGVWSGNVIPGSYDVYAFGEVPDRTDRTGLSGIVATPRVVALVGALAADQNELDLRSALPVELTLRDNVDRALPLERLWITPEALVPAYRYVAVSQVLQARARLDSARSTPQGKCLILTTPGVPLAITALSLAGPAQVLLHSKVTAETLATKVVKLRFAPREFGRLVLAPGTGIGPGQWGRAEVVAVSAVGETVSFEGAGLQTMFVAPGEYRCAVEHRLEDGTATEWTPLRVQVAANEVADLTPRMPCRSTLYYKPKPDEKKMQFWLSVNEAAGRSLLRPPNRRGVLRGIYKGRAHTNLDVRTFRWEEQQKTDSIDPAQVEYALALSIGGDSIFVPVPAELPRTFNVEGASGSAPAAMEAQMLALLPEVKRAVDGSVATLDLPEGGRHIHMEFDVFMPPGVGGTGGGGRITLDLRQLLPFTAPTDLLPGAFRHELGHNLGFGHDPYMLLAPTGVDEERFGAFGYRMLHAADFQRVFSYLDGERHEERDPWNPNEGVFAALRLLFGPDVHKNMLIERRISEQTLNLQQLSSIERIATLYSLSLDRNVAWLFRAHGWPVFDNRVTQGGRAVRFLKKHPKQLNLTRIDGFPVRNWWVYGPEDLEAGQSWRALRWPTGFITADADAVPSLGTRRYLFFTRIVSPVEQEARLVAASDLQLELRVDGLALGSFDASPQYAQPRHDELMLNQKRAFPVTLSKGENILEVAAIQPPGSRGFLIELIDPNGEALDLAYRRAGPGDESGKFRPLPPRDPIYNGSFDQDPQRPIAWIEGATEPTGALAMELDADKKVHGKQSLHLRLKRDGRGGWIQRIAVTPGKKYRLTAGVATRGLDGEAFVGFFTDDLHTGVRGKTEPLRVPNSGWKAYTADWFSGTSRVVYLVCYLKGKQGSAWFDGLRLEEVR
ncbi:MAG: hypothetical protein AAF581_09535 [Planctomycetota bacterium]